jgi:sugar/nucleoside kinase (ribokinase family)
VVRAAQVIREMGPEYVVVKRGEYGALLFTGREVFFAPAYPLESVYDPTGAGDTFAGGLLGYIARSDALDDLTMRHATVMGCVMASFNVEHFSFHGIRDLDDELIRARLERFERLTRFEAVEVLS